MNYCRTPQRRVWIQLQLFIHSVAVDSGCMKSLGSGCMIERGQVTNSVVRDLLPHPATTEEEDIAAKIMTTGGTSTPRTATHCNNCNTLQHTATHCNTIATFPTHFQHIWRNKHSSHRNTLQHTATMRITLQHIYNTFRNTFKGTSILQIHSVHQVATDTRSHVPLRRRAINIDIFRGFGIYCMVPSDLRYGPN